MEHTRIPWFGYVVCVVFIVGVFQVATAVADVVVIGYLTGKCQSFDYNDHPKYQWNWWSKTCSAIMQ